MPRGSAKKLRPPFPWEVSTPRSAPGLADQLLEIGARRLTTTYRRETQDGTSVLRLGQTSMTSTPASRSSPTSLESASESVITRSTRSNPTKAASPAWPSFV